MTSLTILIHVTAFSHSSRAPSIRAYIFHVSNFRSARTSSSSSSLVIEKDDNDEVADSGGRGKMSWLFRGELGIVTGRNSTEPFRDVDCTETGKEAIASTPDARCCWMKCAASKDASRS